MRPVITMTHCSRPDYTRRTLTALSRCRGIENYTICTRVEPGNDEVIGLLTGIDFCEKTVVINPEKLGNATNSIRTVDDGLVLADYVIHVEDDILMAEDALEYFAWAGQEFADTPRVLSVTGYNRTEPAPDQYFTASQRSWFHPWGTAFWKDRWTKLRAELGNLAMTPRGPHNVPDMGWDDALLFCLKQYGLVEVFPRLARCQNFGQASSIHSSEWFTPQWHEANQLNAYWAGDGREVGTGEWRLV